MQNNIKNPGNTQCNDFKSTFGTKYSRMDQVNFVEDSLLAIYYFCKKNSIVDV